jgi:hypothetical protein
MVLGIFMLMVFTMVSTAADAQQSNRTATGKIVTGKTLYVVDGKIVSQLVMNSLPVDRIEKMDVITNIEKAIIVTTNYQPASTNNVANGKNYEVHSIKTVKTSDGDVFKIVADDHEVIKVSKSFNGTIKVKDSEYKAGLPIYLIKSANGTIGHANSRKITAEQIQSMVVLHGEKARAYKRFGDVSNGVILITLKPEKAVNK